jgi:hypothetical protein
MNDTGKGSRGATPLRTDGERSAKQPYRRPTIEKYGDLKDITQAIGLAGNPDGLLGSLNTILRTSIISLILG